MLKPLLLFAHAYPPENLIGARRPERFVRYLPANGFQPFVLTASTQTQADRFVQFVPFHLGWTERAWLKTFFPYDDRMTWAAPAAAAAARWIPSLSGKPVVFSTSPPLSSHIAAGRIAAKFGLAWVADFRDPLAANFNRRAMLGRLADRYLEHWIVDRADFILMNTDAAAWDLAKRHPVAAAKVGFIPNGYDPADRLCPLAIPHREHKLWLHGGSIYSNRYPNRLFDALIQLIRDGRLHNRWRIQMFGTLQDSSLLSRPSFLALEQLGLVSIETEQYPQEVARSRLAAADGTIVFDHYHAHGPNLAIPAKSFDSVLTGRPALAFTSVNTPLDRMLQLAGTPCIRVFEEDPPEIVESKILEFSGLPNRIIQPSESFQELYGAPAQTARLARILEEAARSAGMLRS